MIQELCTWQRLKIPIIAVYRQPKDKDQIVPGIFNEYFRFSPLQSISIVLRPQHSLDDCINATVYGGCKYPTSHCINQVEPKEIFDAFEKLNYILEH